MAERPTLTTARRAGVRQSEHALTQVGRKTEAFLRFSTVAGARPEYAPTARRKGMTPASSPTRGASRWINTIALWRWTRGTIGFRCSNFDGH